METSVREEPKPEEIAPGANINAPARQNQAGVMSSSSVSSSTGGVVISPSSGGAVAGPSDMAGPSTAGTLDLSAQRFKAGIGGFQVIAKDGAGPWGSAFGGVVLAGHGQQGQGGITPNILERSFFQGLRLSRSPVVL